MVFVFNLTYANRTCSLFSECADVLFYVVVIPFMYSYLFQYEMVFVFNLTYANRTCSSFSECADVLFYVVVMPFI